MTREQAILKLLFYRLLSIPGTGDTIESVLRKVETSSNDNLDPRYLYMGYLDRSVRSESLAGRLIKVLYKDPAESATMGDRTSMSHAQYMERLGATCKSLIAAAEGNEGALDACRQRFVRALGYWRWRHSNARPCASQIEWRAAAIRDYGFHMDDCLFEALLPNSCLPPIDFVFADGEAELKKLIAYLDILKSIERARQEADGLRGSIGVLR